MILSFIIPDIPMSGYKHNTDWNNQHHHTLLTW